MVAKVVVVICAVIICAFIGIASAEQASVQVALSCHNGIVSNSAVIDGQTVAIFPDGTSEVVNGIEVGRVITVIIPVGQGTQSEQVIVEVVRGLNVVRPQGQANPTAQAPVPTPVVTPVVTEHVDNGNHVGTGGVNDDAKGKAKGKAK